jgi:hypothetical protein
MFDSSVLTTFSKMSSVVEKSCSECLRKQRLVFKSYLL